MRKLLLLALLAMLLQPALAEFKVENIDVTISGVQKDGSAHVTESIKFFIIGDYEQSLYDSGFSKNDLSFWATTTGLKDVKLHVNPNKVDIKDFRLTPQPKRSCNPLAGLCHGELIIDYVANPYFANDTGGYVEGTGIFRSEKEKPRTTRYALNPDSLSFTSSQQGDIILDRTTELHVLMPAGATLLEANPTPEVAEGKAGAQDLSWSDTVLVRFSLAFEVEESLDKEVAEFFSTVLKAIQDALSGEHGIAILIIAAIFVVAYVYLQSAKKR